MTGTPGDATPGAARPDQASTINEAGATSFVVDGTDSFAVPGPVDHPPAPHVPFSGRARLLGAVGAAVAGLTFVVAIGGGGDGTGAADASVRSRGADHEGDGSGFSLPGWGDGDGDGSAPAVVPVRPTDGDTLRLLAQGQPVSAADAPSFDDDPDADVLDDQGEVDDLDEFDDSDEYGEYDDSYPYPDDRSYDDGFDEDDELPDYRPPSGPPRRTAPAASRPVGTSPRTTTPPAETTTTIAATTTTSAAPTTTVAPTTTAAAVTTTTATAATTTTLPTPPPPVWQPASQGLPSCPPSLRLWSTPERLVAVAGDRLFQRTDGDWTALGGAVPGSAALWAFAPGASASAFWVGGAGGVFATADAGGTYQQVGRPGELAEVRSLAAADGTLLAVTATEHLVRWDATTATWTDETARLPGAFADLGELISDGGTTAWLGTSGGVLRTSDGGISWTAVSTTPVVGTPVRDAGVLYWLAAGGGVLRSEDGGSWTDIAPSGAVDPAARALAVFDGRVVTSGAGPVPHLIALTNPGAGAPWTAAPFGAPTPYVPDGLVRRAPTTFAFTSDCADGQPAGDDPVLALVDP